MWIFEQHAAPIFKAGDGVSMFLPIYLQIHPVDEHQSAKEASTYLPHFEF